MRPILYDKLCSLINDIKCIEGLNLKENTKTYTENIITGDLTGKMDEKTNIVITIELKNINNNNGE